MCRRCIETVIGVDGGKEKENYLASRWWAALRVAPARLEGVDPLNRRTIIYSIIFRPYISLLGITPLMTYPPMHLGTINSVSEERYICWHEFANWSNLRKFDLF